ncbi:hypothetical protein J437_LFUL017320 [Ladona fulva]|uniref:Uncharacterized protein n=1 Tax=Ladona fulva TaxID=123851 RepID=A0A8K0KM76_LADFU|nr:hypothetical protein J437_LFUL017320 [Ladona fulva]
MSHKYICACHLTDSPTSKIDACSSLYVNDKRTRTSIASVILEAGSPRSEESGDTKTSSNSQNKVTPPLSMAKKFSNKNLVPPGGKHHRRQDLQTIRGTPYGGPQREWLFNETDQKSKKEE